MRGLGTGPRPPVAGGSRPPMPRGPARGAVGTRGLPTTHLWIDQALDSVPGDRRGQGARGWRERGGAGGGLWGGRLCGCVHRPHPSPCYSPRIITGPRRPVPDGGCTQEGDLWRQQKCCLPRSVAAPAQHEVRRPPQRLRPRPRRRGRRRPRPCRRPRRARGRLRRGAHRHRRACRPPLRPTFPFLLTDLRRSWGPRRRRRPGRPPARAHARRDRHVAPSPAPPPRPAPPRAPAGPPARDPAGAWTRL